MTRRCSRQYNPIVKTIAITIDEPTLLHMDKLVEKHANGLRNRSELVRRALHQHLAQLTKSAEEERERAIFRRHRARLRRDAAALIRAQADL